MSLSHSTLRLLHRVTTSPDDVLVVGAEVKRTNFQEGKLTVAAVSHKAGIVVLHRAGANHWINRGVGAKYSPAVHMICRFWLVQIRGTNAHETWVEEVCSAPLKRGGPTI